MKGSLKERKAELEDDLDLFISFCLCQTRLKKNESEINKINKGNLRNVSTLLSLSFMCQGTSIKRGEPKKIRKKIKYNNTNR